MGILIYHFNFTGCQDTPKCWDIFSSSSCDSEIEAENFGNFIKDCPRACYDLGFDYGQCGPGPLGKRKYFCLK